MYKKIDPLLLLLFLTTVIVLSTMIGPFFNIDKGGIVDLIPTDEAILLPMLFRIAGFAILIKFYTVYLSLSQLVFSPQVPPPIS
jgi:hypothetical protein